MISGVIFTFMKKTLFHWKQLFMCAISFCLPAIGNSFFFISEKILAIFGMISLISVKCIVYIPLNSHKEFQQWQKVMGIFICSITLVYQNVQKWWKKSQSNTLKKTWQKKTLHCRAGVNITPPNYLFMPKNCFKLLIVHSFNEWCERFIPTKVNLLGIYGHYRIFPVFLDSHCTVLKYVA